MSLVTERSPVRKPLPAEALHDQRWAAVVNRDAAFDGKFCYGVKTTEIYCRPVSPPRRPKPQNVAFYDTCAGAEAAGFRPCRRCQPETVSLAQRQADLIASACRKIEEAE